MTKLLIDINVCLDSLLQRKSFAIESGKILSLAEKKDINGFAAAHSFDTIFYVIRKRLDKTNARQGIKDIRAVLGVAPVTESVIDKAIAAGWDDFEDAIQYHCAKENGCDGIITRNRKDFTESTLPVLSPFEFLARLKSDQEE